jgi:hypothetical protein
MKIALLIAFLCSGLTACTYTQNTGKLPYKVGFQTKNSILKSKISRPNEFFPLIFGSGFKIFDESLLSFE